jgi:hypothetical protein
MEPTTPDIRMLSKPGKVKRDTSADVGAKVAQVATQAKPEMTPADIDPTLNKTAVDDYMEFLKENDISEEDIFKVLDSLITTNNVFWSFELLGKIPVVFRVRPAWVSQVVMRAVESMSPKMFPHFNDIVAMYNLAGSLESYGPTKFQMDNEDHFQASLKFVRDLGFIFQNKLAQQLAIFDRVLAVATSDWAVQNFTQPRSEG